MANATKTAFSGDKASIGRSAADPKLMEERNSLDRRLEALLVVLSGDQALRGRRENLPPSISQRANGVANETRGLLEPPTKTQQDQYAIAAGEFELELPKLRTLVETDLKKFEQKLDAAHVPLTPGRSRSFVNNNRWVNLNNGAAALTGSPLVLIPVRAKSTSAAIPTFLAMSVPLPLRNCG